MRSLLAIEKWEYSMSLTVNIKSSTFLTQREIVGCVTLFRKTLPKILQYFMMESVNHHYSTCIANDLPEPRLKTARALILDLISGLIVCNIATLNAGNRSITFNSTNSACEYMY
jgi:hypothetical protein